MQRSLPLAAKLEILADAAKYDASCASSGADQRNSRQLGGLGSTTACGICHSYTPDGRCVSLLKILLTNFCLYDCVYCVNRRSSDIRRARFSIEEVVYLTVEFYRRNYIEGLFLSSGIIQSADYTMENLLAIVRILRTERQFRGYIHLKTIPEADPALIAEAGRYADRLSINIELPTDQGLRALAPEKSAASIRRGMAGIKLKIDEAKAERAAPRFAPGGQSTQIIIGADRSSDAEILDTSANLYSSYQLRRIYYSAFSPIPHSSSALPLKPPPLAREHRLYQADWLIRCYGFGVGEVVDATSDGMLALHIDPKLAWALNHRGDFPIDVNTATRHSLLRVPGLGTRAVERILQSRKHRRLRLDDLRRLSSSVRRAAPFIVTADHRPTRLLDRSDLAALLMPPRQGSLFA